MNDGQEGSSTSGGKSKRKSKPTSKARSTKQRIKDRYAHAREDAQLAGLIPTTPEDALKSERVDPATQVENIHPELIAEAIRRGWAVPEEKKPLLVDELLEIIASQTELSKVKVAAFRALLIADKDQHERDNPTSKTPALNLPGSTTTTNVTNIHGDVVNNKLTIAQAIREAISRGELGVIEEDGNNRGNKEPELPNLPSTPSQ